MILHPVLYIFTKHGIIHILHIHTATEIRWTKLGLYVSGTSHTHTHTLLSKSSLHYDFGWDGWKFRFWLNFLWSTAKKKSTRATHLAQKTALGWMWFLQCQVYVTCEDFFNGLWATDRIHPALRLMRADLNAYHLMRSNESSSKVRSKLELTVYLVWL